MLTRKKIKFFSKICTFLLMFTLFFDGIAFTQDVNAATAPKLTKKTVSVKAGKKVKNILTKASYNAGWRITKATVKKTALAKAKVKKNKKTVVVTGVQKGKSKVVVALKNAKTGAAKKIKFTVKVIVDKVQPVVAVEKVTLDETDVTLRVDESMVINATVTPNNAANKTVTWESSNNDIVVIENGKKTSDIGTAIIATTTDSKTATGESSDTDIISVQNGIITAKKVGTATITATADGKTATCKITVVDKTAKIAVKSFELNQKKLKLKPGDKTTLEVTAKEPWNASIDEISWKSSDSDIVSVKYGEVTAKKTGTATITATVNGTEETCKVEVVDIIPLEDIKFASTSIALRLGETGEILYSLEPWNATIDSIEWEVQINSKSPNQNIILFENGKVTAVELGTVRVDLTVCGFNNSGGDLTKKKSVNIRVSKANTKKNTVPVDSIALDKKTMDLQIGDTGILKGVITPENATDKTITWISKNPSIAEVSQLGVVSAKTTGTTTIFAITDSASTSCVVTVKPTNPTDPLYPVNPGNSGDPELPVVVPVTNVTLDSTDLEITVGEKRTLKASVLPDNATDKSVTWNSNNLAVATVSESGEITAVSVGTAVITVKAGDKTAECTVTVNPIAVTAITLSSNSLGLKIGESQTLTATVTPDNAMDKTVTWTSDNTAVATVSESGEINAVSVGTANITARAGEKTASCTITVNPIAVTAITLSQNSLALKVSESQTLTAAVTPDNATDKTVTWTSSDERVAVVSGGAVRAVAAGNAIVTAKAGDKTAECTVTVTKIEAQAPQITNANTLPQSIRFNSDWMFSVDNGVVAYLNGTVGYSIKVNAKVEDGGTLSYQWYLADSSEGVGRKINNEISDTITIKEGSVFEDLKQSVDNYKNYLYVVVTNTKDGETKETVSQRITIDYKSNYFVPQNV